MHTDIFTNCISLLFIAMFVLLQDYLHSSLAPLLDTHVFGDSGGGLGQIVLELGHAETFIVRSSRDQPPADLSDMPSHLGSTLYQLLVDPDNVTLDKLTLDQFTVSIQQSILFSC